jgi:hypothetical protein
MIGPYRLTKTLGQGSYGKVKRKYFKILKIMRTYLLLIRVFNLFI